MEMITTQFGLSSDIRNLSETSAVNPTISINFYKLIVCIRKEKNFG